MRRKNKYIKKRKKIISLVTSWIFVLGLFMGVLRFGYKCYLQVKNNYQVEEYFKMINYRERDVLISLDDSVYENTIMLDDKRDYLGVLEVPKINLKRIFFDINSSENDVSKNLQLVKGSDMPSVKGGNVIIAAHSGDSYVSYFKKIDELKMDDLAYVYYDNVKYTYKLFEKYEVLKNGKIKIKRNNEKNILTLTTCNRMDETKQMIYLFELINEINLN